MENNVNLNWYPGHMAKTRREIAEDLKLIDVVVEVLDARIPYSSRNPDIKRLTRDKEKIIILNKADLADDNITKSWVKYFEEKENTLAIPLDSNRGRDFQNVKNAIHEKYEKVNAKYISQGRKSRVAKVMVLGIPNVGKSTLINKLSNKTSLNVENRPGVTRKKQWINIDEGISLLDTPGMLWPKIEEGAYNLAYTNTISKNVYDSEVVAFALIKFLYYNYPKKLEERYKIDLDRCIDYETDTDIALDIREQIARKRGAIMSGGRIDELKVSNLVLKEFQDGIIGKISIERPEF